MADADTELRLAGEFLQTHPHEAARVIETRSAAEVEAVLGDVAPEKAAAVLQRMVPASAARYLVHVNRERAAKLLGCLPLDSTAMLLRMLPHSERDPLVRAFPRSLSTPLRRLLAYPEETAGALMDPSVFVVPNDIAVRAAAERLRKNPRTARYYVYVVDREQRLVGVFTLRELMVASRDLSVSALMQAGPLSVRATAGRLEIVAHRGWRKFHALPVVDGAGVLLGVVRYETLRRLEGEVGGGQYGHGAFDLAVSLSELYVRGLASLVNGLLPRSTADSLGPSPDRGREAS